MSTPEAIVFDVEYTDTCAKCAKEGKPGVLTGFAFAAGGVVCQNGHQQEESKPAEPKPAPAKPLANSGAFGRGEKPQPEQGKPVQQVAAVVPSAVRVHSPHDLQGGDIEIKLIIPDQYASAVKAEAEIQHQTLEEYMQGWIAFALANQWGR